MRIYSTSEFSYLEISQVLILFLNILFHLKYKRLFLKFGTFFEFFARISLLTFIIYEELSFLTENKFEFFNAINHQSELSFHNLNILRIPIVENISLPSFNYEFTIPIAFVFFSISLFFMGYGSQFKFLKKYQFLFLDKKLSLFSFVYFLNTIISSKVFNSFEFLKIKSGLELQSSEFFIHSEYIELFIYIVFILDTIIKINKLCKQS